MVPILRNFIAVELKKFEEDVSKIEKEREKKQFDQKLANKFDQISEKANDFLNDIWEKLNLDSINNQKMTKKMDTAVKLQTSNHLPSSQSEFKQLRHVQGFPFF